MKTALMSSAFLVISAWAAPSAAQDSGNSTLTGKYGFTSNNVCNYASGAVITIVTEGIHTFHGDGTGAVTQRDFGSTAGTFASGSTNNLAYTFKYSVSDDGTFTVNVDPGSVTGTFLSGPNAGLTISIDQLATMTGVIGVNANTLTAATLEPKVETITISNGNVSQRKCQRSRVYNKVGEQ
jgi:hypothetical protein